MNLESYLATAAELGIQRGKLDSGWLEEKGPLERYMDEPINWKLPQRVVPPPIAEDLSALVNPPTRRTVVSVAERMRRTKPATRNFYQRSLARGMTTQRLAELTGLPVYIVQRTIVSQVKKHRARLATHLTTDELSALGWDKSTIGNRKSKIP